MLLIVTNLCYDPALQFLLPIRSFLSAMVPNNGDKQLVLAAKDVFPQEEVDANMSAVFHLAKI